MNNTELAERIAHDVRPTKQAICAILELTEAEYAELQYNEGLRYLSAYIPDDEWGQDMLLRSRAFWNWWKNAWELRDRCFIHISIRDTKAVSVMRVAYLVANDGVGLTKDIHPNGVILNLSYTEMLSRLIDSTKKVDAGAMKLIALGLYLLIFLK